MNDEELNSVGLEILADGRNRLYMSMPYLDQLLFALRPQPGEGKTVSLATDGEVMYFSGTYLSDLYLRSAENICRLQLHTLLHCLLRHIWKKEGHDSVLWDLACDAAVESILDGLPYACLGLRPAPVRQRFYTRCLGELKVLTAEGIYRVLRKDRTDGFELAALQREFLMDDHGLWDPQRQDSQERADRDEKWRKMASQMQTRMETSLSEEANGGEAVMEQVRISARNDVDYREFLRRFAMRREIVKSDPDAFDPIFYTYGLRHYGNMPLIEFPETREEKRLGDLVIAIDTSMSTSGSLVREFLSCTYSILRSSETLTDRFRIHVMQCDDTLRDDAVITSAAELRSYMENVSLKGGSATDFRPVFDRIAELRRQGVFSSFRGLIYFTDGMGIYPPYAPDYETAFVLVEEPPLSYRMPVWCKKIVLDIPAMDRLHAENREETAWPEDDDEERDEMPEL